MLRHGGGIVTEETESLRSIIDAAEVIEQSLVSLVGSGEYDGAERIVVYIEDRYKLDLATLFSHVLEECQKPAKAKEQEVQDG